MVATRNTFEKNGLEHKCLNLKKYQRFEQTFVFQVRRKRNHVKIKAEILINVAAA